MVTKKIRGHLMSLGCADIKHEMHSKICTVQDYDLCGTK